MLLSIQQKFILEALRKLGYMRQDQLYTLTREKFKPAMHISDTRMEAMLRQLKNRLGGFRAEGEIVSLSNAPPDSLHLEAIDVMLELTRGAPLEFGGRLRRPVLLQFTWGPTEVAAQPFAVALLPDGEVQRTQIFTQYRHSRVIWLSASGKLPDGLSLPPTHFFAARTPDGSHCFYGSEAIN